MNAGKYQSVETNPEMIELAHKHVEIYYNYFYMNIGKYEKIFTIQIGLLEMEITTSEVKMSFDGVNGRKDQRT